MSKENLIFARWDDPLGRYAQSYMSVADSFLKPLKAIDEKSPQHMQAEIVVARIEQQLIVGNRLRKIIDVYSKSSHGGLTVTQAILIGGVAWPAMAAQFKAALAGFLQQLRLDVICATHVLCAHRPDMAESTIAQVAHSMFTMNTEINKILDNTVAPLMVKAQSTLAAATDITSLARTVSSLQSNSSQHGGGGASASGGGGGAAAVVPPTGTQSERGESDRMTTVTGVTGSGAGGGAAQLNIVTLNANCQEYVNALSAAADPVISALSVACRGQERLHRVHVELLRGVFSNVVLGLVRRHSLLVNAVKTIRDISQKYHRIVQGQGALRTIRESAMLVMGDDDAVPEPAGKLAEVDTVGRLLQELMASTNVLCELVVVLKHWASEDGASSSGGGSGGSRNLSPSRHAFDHPHKTKTATASQHLKNNGQYLLQTLRNTSSLLRRTGAACEKALSVWSEPALNAFSRILEIHSAPLLQCARVMANAQTDMKQLVGNVREKAVEVEEARNIEDTLAVIGPTASSMVFTSFEQRLKDIDRLAHTIHSTASRSTSVLSDVVSTLCKAISAHSKLLPFQYIDNEIELLSQSMSQLCAQHDATLDNLRATTTSSSSVFGQASSSQSTTTTTTSAGGAKLPHSSSGMSLQELTTASTGRLSEAEQRAVSASCSFERLRGMVDEIDASCSKFASDKEHNRSGENLDVNEGLKTLTAQALLKPNNKEEDRVFTQQVLKGTMDHLQDGERTFLKVPRPDTVSSPSALNAFEDEFSAAFVGVEGLCEQVFSGSHQAPISVTSASSLDVLARIGAAASPQRMLGGGPDGGRRMMRSPSQSSAGGATTTNAETVTPSQHYGGGGGGGGSAIGGGGASSRYHSRARGATMVNFANSSHHSSSASSPMSSLANRGVGSPSSGSTFGSPLLAAAAAATPDNSSNLQQQHSSVVSSGLRKSAIRSYTYRAAETMPEHEMIPPESC